MSSDISSRPLNNPVTVQVPKRVNAGEFLLWTVGLIGAAFWTSTILTALLSKTGRRGVLPIEAVLLKNSGLTALVISTSLISILCLVFAVFALRGKKIAQPSASVVLITGLALRSIQLFYEASATIADADFMAALMLLAALLYFGSGRLWWGVLMPLGTAACFAPLVWLEFFAGAKHASLIRALVSPAGAFVVSSILIISRELRLRAQVSLSELSRVQTRGVNLKKQMYAMENDLKSLMTIVSISRPALLVSEAEQPEAQPDTQLAEMLEAKPLEELGESAFQPAEAGPIVTTEFAPEPSSTPISESSSYEDLDRAAREVLDEARAGVEGRKSIRLLLTAPVGATLPLAVRASRALVAKWMKALVANSIDSLGGFPDGVVRVTLRPGLSSVVISIEDNGRGFNDDLLTKLGASAGSRMTSLEVRKEVEAIGGRFEIQARLGVGARLTIELPRIDRAGSRSESKSHRPNDYRPIPSSSLRA